MRHLPVLLAITFRPEFQPPWGGRSYVMNLTLNRLGEGDGEALAHKLAIRKSNAEKNSVRDYAMWLPSTCKCDSETPPPLSTRAV